MFFEQRDAGPQTPGDRWFLLGFVLLLVGLFTAAVVSDFSLAKLAAVFVVVFWMPLLALHEAGHALAAKALGWYVGQVVIGFGPIWRRFELGGAHVQLRSFPVEGFVRCVPRNLAWPRTKSALIYFAGPGIELAAAACVLWLAGPQRLLAQPESVGVAALQGLALAAASGGVLNLLPHGVTVDGVQVPNDGLGILRSFVLPEAYFAQQIGRTYNPTTDTWDEYDPADWWKR